jgi:hypothetical protein
MAPTRLRSGPSSIFRWGSTRGLSTEPTPVNSCPPSGRIWRSGTRRSASRKAEPTTDQRG